MPKRDGATVKPAAGPTALACGHAACGKALAPPLMLCSKCRAEAYCCKACQVERGRPRHAQRDARAHGSLIARLRLLPFPLPLPPAARSPRGRPGTRASAARLGAARRRRRRSSCAARGRPRRLRLRRLRPRARRLG